MQSNLFSTIFFIMFILWSSPNHIPIKYRYWIKKDSNQHPHTLGYRSLRGFIVEPTSICFWKHVSPKLKEMDDVCNEGMPIYKKTCLIPWRLGISIGGNCISEHQSLLNKSKGYMTLSGGVLSCEIMSRILTNM